MSTHNLFVHRADGTAEPASSREILSAARAVLEHRVRRGAALQSPQKVGEYLTMRLGLVLVDNRHRVIECVELFRGTIDGASVHPREVIKLLLEKEAAGAIAYHNHPSGVKDQSHADEIITRKLVDAFAAVDARLIDHVICAGPHILSFAQQGLL